MKYNDTYSILRMCHILGVSKSGYYDWIKSSESQRSIENQELLSHIQEIHTESKRCYGSPKILDVLRSRGYKCGHNRIVRIMNENGIRSKVVKKFRPKNEVIKIGDAIPNVLNRRFSWEQPNQAWVTDITYIPMESGWAYLCVFLDLCSRIIVGWSVAENMKKELVIDALDKGLKSRKPDKGLIIHSDQGSQFGSDSFKNSLKKNEFVQSMSRRGNCWDNACVESFFRLIKVEELNDYSFENIDQVRYAIFVYIDYFYNRKRIHSKLKYMSPMDYEKKLIA